jgi:UDP-sulfoquinovose synthase
VIIVDNLSRRDIDNELGTDSLTPIQSPDVRVQAWEEVSGKKIRFVNLNVAEEYAELLALLQEEKPDSIVHFAEQRAAPYSMR